MRWLPKNRGGLAGVADIHVGANAVYLGVGVIVSFGSVPILSRALGPEQYTLWLVATAIPAYLTFSDFGLATAGSVKVTHLLSSGRRIEATRLFWTYAKISLAIVTSICMAGALLLTFLPLLAFQDIRLNLLLAAWVMAAYISILLEGGFRASGKFGRGVLSLAGQRLVETAAIWTYAWFADNDLVEIALLQLVSRVVAVGATAWYFWLRVPELRPAKCRGDARMLRGLIGPSAGFFFIPGGQLLVIQASTVAAGANLSASLVVAFTASRLLVGLIRQMGSAVTAGYFPELTRLHGAGDEEAFRSLARRMDSRVLVTTVGGVVFLGSAGSEIVRMWIGSGQGVVSHSVVALLLVYAAGEVVWTLVLAREMSANSHTRKARAQFLLAVLTSVSAFFAAEHAGILGLAACLACYGFALSAASFRALKASRRG